MKTIIHLAKDRFSADHGWLKARHTFSFAGMYDPERIHFGALRVLNDDIVTGGMGFGMHPHDNMEIITIPLQGSLKHKDSMGHEGVIKSGDVQVMSAGTGLMHSEHNAEADAAINLLQIWVFPKVKGVQPRYDQKYFEESDRKNKWQYVVSPDGKEGSLWIHQDAWFAMTNLDPGHSLEYKLNKAHSGIYVFVIEGSITINGLSLDKRDGAGLEGKEKYLISANNDSKVLLMELPMKW